jgi:hypothetical protein
VARSSKSRASFGSAIVGRRAFLLLPGCPPPLSSSCFFCWDLDVNLLCLSVAHIFHQFHAIVGFGSDSRAPFRWFPLKHNPRVLPKSLLAQNTRLYGLRRLGCSYRCCFFSSALPVKLRNTQVQIVTITSDGLTTETLLAKRKKCAAPGVGATSCASAVVRTWPGLLWTGSTRY